MKDHHEKKSLVRMADVVLTWPRGYFEIEARINAREPLRRSRLRSALKAGDRVSFDMGEGVDGPTYATNVRLIKPE